MTLIVGLTGGIGSGKTLVSNHFAELGVPIIDTDVIARQVVAPRQPTLNALVRAFGEQIVTSDGTLDRDKLRELAFASETTKAQLDAITHPAIREQTIRQVKAVNHPYCIIVIPLLTAESAFAEFLQRIVTVSCEIETRVQRVMTRNRFSRDQVMRIVRTQLSDVQREALADDVICNNGSKQEALEATNELHDLYLNLSRISSRERS